MGIWDALSILGGGVSRGYVARQDVERQLTNARLKQMMDERDLALREREQALQERLGTSTIANQDVARQTGEFNLGEAKTRALESQAPIVPAPPVGPPQPNYNFHSDILKQDFSIPNRISALENPAISNLIQQEIQGRASMANAQAAATSRRDVASMRVNFQKQSGTPIQRWFGYLKQISGALAPFADPDAARAWRDEQVGFIKGQDLEAYNAGHGITAGAGGGKKVDPLEAQIRQHLGK